MDEIVKTFSNLKSTHRYYCDECNDTGKEDHCKQQKLF